VQYLTGHFWKNRQIAEVLQVHEKHIPRMRQELTPKAARQVTARAVKESG
jgi:hypothetical protein